MLEVWLLSFLTSEIEPISQFYISSALTSEKMYRLSAKQGFGGTYENILSLSEIESQSLSSLASSPMLCGLG
jgi:hypothetical protein